MVDVTTTFRVTNFGVDTYKSTVVGGIGTRVLQLALTSAQILALHTTPQQVVPAPGAGYVNQVESVIYDYTFGTTAYTDANAIGVYYAAAGSPTKQADASTFVATGGASSITTFGAAAAASAVPAVVDNRALLAYVPTADPTLGDGTLKITVTYRVIKR